MVGGVWISAEEIDARLAALASKHGA